MTIGFTVISISAIENSEADGRTREDVTEGEVTRCVPIGEYHCIESYSGTSCYIDGKGSPCSAHSTEWH